MQEGQIKWAISFYTSCIESGKADMEEILSDMREGIQRYPKENWAILASCAASLFSEEMKLICAKYSDGAPLPEIERHFYEAVGYLSGVEQDNLGYTNTLWLTALGILFEANHETFEVISKKAIHFNDALLDYLLRSTGIPHPDCSCGFYKKVPYCLMQQIIQLPAAEKNSAAKIIEDYLNHDWFMGHKDYYWLEAHKRRDYVGFWSFESAALVKLLDLDESKISCPKYYPYGLVGYRRQKAE